MKRQIKFRGKRNNGQWVYGGLCRRWDDKPCIVAYNPEERDDAPGSYEDNWDIYVDVYEDTIGQFTGLTDKNGKEIYEGDIVRYYDDIEDELVSSHVIYHKESCSFCVAPTKLCGDYIGICAHWQYEVIGNIHDNPEQLKGGEM